MARLVTPGYDRSTLIAQTLAPVEERCLEFKGLNRREVVEEGEMSDMLNLCSDDYPILSPRKPRGELTLPEGVKLPLQIMAKYNRLAMIARDTDDSISFYFDGVKIDEVDDLTYDTKMVSINTKICFYSGSRKTCISVLQRGTSAGIVTGSYTSLEESVAVTNVSVVTSNEDARIVLSGIKNFNYDDAVDISGTLAYTAGGTQLSVECKVSCIIEEVIKDETNEQTTLVLPRETFIELTGEGATDIALTGAISRSWPDLDFVIEWNNRLWGASSSDNTVYACKLGDPTNWHYFQSTGLDSFYAQQGTDGIWTGCATYSSHVIFFKQDSMTRIYGTSPATFQVANAQCYGVEEGSDRSTVTINDRVFYKSAIGIMCYEGGIPYCVSEKFNTSFRNVIGGTEGSKYYASIQDAKGGFPLLVLDIDKGVWHKEDSTRMTGTCTIDNRLYFINAQSEALKCGPSAITSQWLLVGHGAASNGKILIINPLNANESTEDIEWMAQFGPFDEYMENRKIYSKILMRLVRSNESEVKVYISENEGAWELVQDFYPTKTGGDYIPIIPRRCDRYSIKIEGKGKCSVKSLTRKVRRGTGGRL